MPTECPSSGSRCTYPILSSRCDSPSCPSPAMVVWVYQRRSNPWRDLGQPSMERRETHWSRIQCGYKCAGQGCESRVCRQGCSRVCYHEWVGAASQQLCIIVSYSQDLDTNKRPLFITISLYLYKHCNFQRHLVLSMASA